MSTLNNEIFTIPESEIIVDPLAEIKQTLEKQALEPPGRDKVISACYTATLDLLSNQNPLALNDDEVVYPGRNMEKVFTSVSEARDISSEYFVNLYLRCLQFMQLDPFTLYNRDYPNPEIYSKPENWLKDLTTIASDTQLCNLLEKLLIEQDTTTTQFQRYLGPQTILKSLYPNQEIRIADFGCSIMEGLKGMMSGRKFEPVVDGTPNQLVSKASRQDENTQEDPIITSAYGFDRYNPAADSTLNWQYVCQYPSDIAKAGSFENWKQSHVSKTPKNLHFIEADLTAPLEDGVVESVRLGDQQDGNGLDAVSMITMIYQLNEEQQRGVIDNAKRLLKPGGVIIVQDFARINQEDNTMLETRGVDWTSKDNPYRLYLASENSDWNFQEVFCWNNGRCTKVEVCNTDGYNSFVAQTS